MRLWLYYFIFGVLRALSVLIWEFFFIPVSIFYFSIGKFVAFTPRRAFWEQDLHLQELTARPGFLFLDDFRYTDTTMR